MKKLIIFIGIVLFTSFVSTSVFADETKTLTQEEKKEKLKADYKAQADVVKRAESNASLTRANEDYSNALKTLREEKTAAEAKLKTLKAELEKIQKETGYSEIEKQTKILEADTAVKTQEGEIEKINKGIEGNEITTAEKKVTDAKNELSNIAGKTALWTLAYETSAGFDVTKHLKASGDGDNPNDGSQEGQITIVPGDGEDGNNIFYRIIRLMSQVIGTFAILMMIVGGFFMITSKGDESRLTKGKNIFTNTMIGLLIAFLSYLAVTVIISVLF